MIDWGKFGRNVLKGMGDVLGWKTSPANPNQQRVRQLGQLGINEAALQDYLAEIQRGLDTRTANQRRQGHNIRLTPEVRYEWVGNTRILCRLYETGDPTRLDIFYGGDGRPDGTGHGHITVSKGRITSWRLPADTDGRPGKKIV